MDRNHHQGVFHNRVFHNGLNHNGVNHNGVNHNGVNHYVMPPWNTLTGIGSSGGSGNLSKPKSGKPRRRVATAAQRRAANIRERRRMFNLNTAFDRLRKKLPTFPYEKRLSRIETLRLAIMYIRFMTEFLNSNSPVLPAYMFSENSTTANGDRKSDCLAFKFSQKA